MGNRLLLTDGLPALPLSSSPSYDAPSRIQSPAGSFLSLAGGGFFDPLSGVFPGPVLQALVEVPNSRPGSGPSSPLSSSTDGTDGLMTRNNFSAAPGPAEQGRQLRAQKREIQLRQLVLVV